MNWLQQLKTGNRDGFDAAWRLLQFRTQCVVRKWVRGHVEADVDPEQITVDVFLELWQASVSGRLSTIRNGNELWFWILRAAKHQTIDQKRRIDAVKAGGQTTQVSLSQMGGYNDWDLEGRESDGEVAAILREEFQRGIAALGSAELRDIAVMHLDGYLVRDIKQAFGLAEATVNRRLRELRTTWAALR